MNLWPKAVDCLRIASTPIGLDRDALYAAACARWSEKAVWRKLEELYARGYIARGVSVRTGWLTDKGKASLAQVGAQ